MNLHATFNTSSRTWSFEHDDAPDWVEVRIGFAEDGIPVDLRDWTFGFVATVDGEQVASAEHPKGGIRYVSSDEPFITYDAFFQPADTPVDVTFTVSKASGVYEDSVSFVVPRAPQPFPSWSWNGETWVAPVPLPEGPGDWMWDEENQVWFDAAEED